MFSLHQSTWSRNVHSCQGGQRSLCRFGVTLQNYITTLIITGYLGLLGSGGKVQLLYVKLCEIKLKSLEEKIVSGDSRRAKIPRMERLS